MSGEQERKLRSHGPAKGKGVLVGRKKGRARMAASFAANASLPTLEWAEKNLREDSLAHETSMSVPVATSTGYLEHVVQIQEIVRDPGTEAPQVPVVDLPSTPGPVQKYPIEAVV